MGLCGPPAPHWQWWQLPMVALCMVSYHSFSWYPYSLVSFGGAWYVLILFAFFVIIALPFMFVQIRLGATTRRDVVSLLSKYIPGLQGVGAALLLQMFILALLVGVTLSYILWYMLHAMASEGGHHYDWARCDNSWNSKNCCPPGEACTGTSNSTGTSVDAEYEYFDQVLLQRSGAWNDLGGLVPHLIWPLFLVWLFIFAVVVGGPRVFPWVVGVVGFLGLLVVCMLLGYVFQSLAPEDARDGLNTLYVSLSFTSWSFVYPSSLMSDVAMLTVMWFGILPSYGKFCGRGKTVSALAWLPILVLMLLLPNVVAIMLSGYYGALAKKMNTSIFMLIRPSNRDFILTLSKMTCRLEMSPFWGSMLYVPVFFFGAIFQGLIALVITDSICNGIYRGRLRYNVPKVAVRAILAALYCAVAFLLSLPLVTKGGSYLSAEVGKSLFLLELLYFTLYAIALCVCYGRAMHLDILEKVIVMTVSGISAFLAWLGILWADPRVLHDMIGFNAWIWLSSSKVLFRLCVAIGPLLLCGIIGLIHALCVAPSGCERRMTYTFGGDRFDAVPAEEDEIFQDEVAIPLEVEPEEKEPFPEVDLDNYEEPEIIPLYPSPPPSKHQTSVQV